MLELDWGVYQERLTIQMGCFICVNGFQALFSGTFSSVFFYSISLGIFPVLSGYFASAFLVFLGIFRDFFRIFFRYFFRFFFRHTLGTFSGTSGTSSVKPCRYTNLVAC